MKTVTPTELREMLKQGPVKFQYKKKDGSIREAVGTVNPGIIEEAGATPNGGVCHPKSAGYSVYYDIKEEGFRCYDESQIVGVVEE